MADGANKLWSNKQVQAIAFNQQQQRLLEKTLQTIDLEESYAIKLLELGDREVRLRQSNLQSRVSKIKSHLEPKDVKEIRELEMKGKLKPMFNTLNTNSALRISATAKRLNMGPDGKTLRQNPRASPGAPPGSPPNLGILTATPSPRPHTKRRGSLTGVFHDAVGTDDRKSPDVPATSRSRRGFRPDTLGLPSDSNKSRRGKNYASMVPPSTSVKLYIDTSPRASTPKTKDPNTQPSRNRENPKNTDSKLLSGSRPTSQTGRFRCDSESSEKSLSRYRMIRRQSSFSLGSFDKEQAKERMNEAVQDRLELELLKTSEIQKRRKDFMQKINKWVDENPSLVTDTNGALPASTDSKTDSTAARPITPKMGHFRNQIFPRKNNSSGEHWTDLRKCRYLRIPDDKVDYSGVNTLVRDQMALYNSSLFTTIMENQEVL